MSGGPDSERSPQPRRREFLAASASLAGAGWLALNAPVVLAAGKIASERRAAGAAWVSLDDSQAASLAAVVDQLIPPDDLPGAAELGVVHFIDQALGDFMAGSAAGFLGGLAELERRAQRAGAGASGFAGLAFDQQTAVLREIESEPFFAELLFLTHCGMFAMPARGGNREQGGWKLIGFDSRHAWQPPFGYYDGRSDGEDDRA